MTAPNEVGFTPVVDSSRSPHAFLRPVSVSAVTLTGGFWGPRRRINAEVSLPNQWEQLERTGRLDNFRRVAGRAEKPHQGLMFNDTDLYKWIEAVSWSLCHRRDAALERHLEEAIELIEGAQAADGYLDTYYSLERAGERWSNLRDMHELYCAGHLIQAAVAHHRATGADRLLLAARRFADLICSVFGPPGSGRRLGIDGHEEVELALVELSRETGDLKYLEQARFFLEARGQGLLEGGQFGAAYFQDHLPFRALRAMEGHAVRALYYNAGMADLYLETGDPTLLETLTRLFEHMTARQIYVSGGVGARHEGEAFGADFELPNARAYTETCAAIASLMWCHRMLAATGEARYADLLETTLLNSILPGWSLDGLRYFYVNPLEDQGGHARQEWYPCSCCPPNVARTVASLPGYVYGTAADAVYVHLYAQGTARLDLGGRTVVVTQRTEYPWDGNVELEVDGAGTFGLCLRIPGWCGTGARLTVNGAPAGVPLAPASYAELRREWRPGDQVRLELPMPVRLLESHPYLTENAGRLALQRGPLLYCLEGIDHPGLDLRDLTIDPDQPVEQEWRPELLGGVVVLRGRGAAHPPEPEWRGRLYRPASPSAPRGGRPVGLTAVPYYAWGNRGAAPMQVWVRRAGRG